MTPRTEADIDASRALPCDLVELRLDTPARARVAASLAALDKPAIASCRRRADGGLEVLDEEKRRAALAEAVEAGAAFVDVEDDAPFRRDLSAAAHRKNARTIVSHHDLSGTPDAKACLARLRAMRDGADVVKLATRVTGPDDIATLAEVALAAPALGVPFAIMGVGDASLRAAAGALGMALVYATPGRAVAPGQLPVTVQARLPRGPAPPRGERGYVLLGHPVSHSLSPRMQEAAFAHLGLDARYRAIDVEPERVNDAMRALVALGAAGGNVTTPHKDAVFALCDETTPEAQAARAVNAFRIDAGRIVGHTTDGLGAVEALTSHGETLKGRAALVAGAGGTARSVAHALAKAGARVTIANRTVDKAQALATAMGGSAVGLDEQALRPQLLKDTVLVNCTPVDLPVPDATLGRIVTLDASYGASGGALARRARAAGGRVLSGVDLLVGQGVHALAFWQGSRPSEDTRGVMACAARTTDLESAFGGAARADR